MWPYYKKDFFRFEIMINTLSKPFYNLLFILEVK
jgi:hypothetical protein